MFSVSNSDIVLGVIFTGWILVWSTLGYYATKRMALREFQVTLTEAQLTIRPTDSVKERLVPLSQIASYSYLESGNGRRFSLRLQSGEQLAFEHSDTFCAADDLPALAAQFEARVQAPNAFTAPSLVSTTAINPLAAIQREKTFFEKPIANVIGWFIAAGLCYFSWHLLQYGAKDGKWSSALVIYGNGLAYLGAWFAARQTKAGAA